MSLPVLFRPDALADVVAARDWYDARHPDLGDRFSASVAAVLDRVARHPALFGILWEDVRACRVQGFPYVVYYRVLETRIEILAVLHGRRDPSAWRDRR